LEPDLGNTSEGNDSQIRTTNRTKPFPAGDGLFIGRVSLAIRPQKVSKLISESSEVKYE
jgi:hypothetical protein